MELSVKILALVVTVVGVLDSAFAQEQSQNQTVIFCPLYLFLQNRCPTPSTTTTRTTTRRTTPSSNDTDSDVVDEECGLPTISFCPVSQIFLPGSRNCTAGQTINIRWTTLRELLTDPSDENAEATVGRRYVEELGNTFESVAKSIRAPPTQESATVGVTFIPVGQIIG